MRKGEGTAEKGGMAFPVATRSIDAHPNESPLRAPSPRLAAREAEGPALREPKVPLCGSQGEGGEWRTRCDAPGPRLSAIPTGAKSRRRMGLRGTW